MTPAIRLRVSIRGRPGKRPDRRVPHWLRASQSCTGCRAERWIRRAAVGEHLATASSAATWERLRWTSIPTWAGIEGIFREFVCHPER
jgi:hypothetical protein